MSSVAVDEPQAALEHGFPVVEVFGPTIQGEGPDAGQRAYFIRLGGCDYRCTWCDSMHAVEPALVRQARKVTAGELAEHLVSLGAMPHDVAVLSGGNPALHKAPELVARLQRLALRVSVETQGSMWRPWLALVDRLVVSPKPPSSGMAARTAQEFPVFMRAAYRAGAEPALKIVVFDRPDYEWALRLIAELEHRPAWIGLSCGTDSKGAETLLATAERYRWLCERVADERDRALAGVVVLPQLHVIAWGHELGR